MVGGGGGLLRSVVTRPTCTTPKFHQRNQQTLLSCHQSDQKTWKNTNYSILGGSYVLDPRKIRAPWGQAAGRRPGRAARPRQGHPGIVLITNLVKTVSKSFQNSPRTAAPR